MSSHTGLTREQEIALGLRSDTPEPSEQEREAAVERARELAAAGERHGLSVAEVIAARQFDMELDEYAALKKISITDWRAYQARAEVRRQAEHELAVERKKAAIREEGS